MHFDDNRNDIELIAGDIIRAKVRQITRRHRFGHPEREDLQQDLFCRVFGCLKSFDPERGGIKAFIAVIVDSGISNFIRSQRTKKKTLCRTSDVSHRASLDNLSEYEWHASRSRRPRRFEDQSELKIDIETIQAQLAADQRDLAERLKTKPISEVARELGIPRTTLNERVRRLRRHFEKAGLREYLY
jgi:RNA polymerase sigma-70 factor (ECF subfamily)